MAYFDYLIYTDGKIGEESIGFIQPTLKSTVSYGWLNLCGTAADRTVSKTKFAKLLTWATNEGLYGSGKPFVEGSDPTTFVIPDFREVALKGIGLTSKSSTHYDSSGLTIGKFIEDRNKKHAHSISMKVSATNAGGGNCPYGSYSGSGNYPVAPTGTEDSGGNTNEVKAIGVNYFIKAL